MSPNLQEGDICLVIKTKKIKPSKVNELINSIVIIDKAGTDICKRVIALTGDTIRYDNETLSLKSYTYFKKENQLSPYLTSILSSQTKQFYIIPYKLTNIDSIKIRFPLKKQEYSKMEQAFVAGDNIINSYDSFDYGPVPINLISHKLILIMKKGGAITEKKRLINNTF